MPFRLLAAVMALAIAVSASPAAAQPDAPAETTSAVDVPVFGTTLVITVVADASGEFVRAEVVAADPSPEADALASGFVTTSEREDGGFEVDLVNDAAGVKIEIEVGSDGTVQETEIEGDGPGAIVGSAVWRGDPLGLGTGSAVVPYEVTIGPDGRPILTIVEADIITEGDLFVQLLEPTAFDEPHEDEYGIRQIVYFWNAASDTVDLVFAVEVERDESELKIKLVFPNNRDDDDDDDHDDDDDDDDHDDDDDDDDDDHDDDDDDDHDGDDD